MLDYDKRTKLEWHDKNWGQNSHFSQVGLRIGFAHYSPFYYN